MHVPRPYTPQPTVFESFSAASLMQVAAETEQGATVAELPGGPLDGPIHAAALDADTVRNSKKRISDTST